MIAGSRVPGRASDTSRSRCCGRFALSCTAAVSAASHDRQEAAQPLRGRGQRHAVPGRDRRGGYRQGKREEAGVAKEKDPAEIIETIAQSIRVSQRGARRVRAHRFKELFGYQVLNSQRRERIGAPDGGGRSRCGRPSRTRDATTGWSCRCRWKFRAGGQSRPGADSGVACAHGLGAHGHRAGGRDALRLAAAPRGTRLQRGAGGSRVRNPVGPGEAPRDTSRQTCCTSPTTSTT